jgi:hypothetical protein
MRRVINRIVSALSAEPYGMEVTLVGHTSITVGCERCPDRRTMRFPPLSGVSLEMPTIVPLKVEGKTRLDIDDSRVVAFFETEDKVEVSQRPCAGDACPYGTAVGQAALYLEQYAARVAQPE